MVDAWSGLGVGDPLDELETRGRREADRIGAGQSFRDENVSGSKRSWGGYSKKSTSSN